MFRPSNFPRTGRDRPRDPPKSSRNIAHLPPKRGGDLTMATLRPTVSRLGWDVAGVVAQAAANGTGRRRRHPGWLASCRSKATTDDPQRFDA
jgi:hypothetical protein